MNAYAQNSGRSQWQAAWELDLPRDTPTATAQTPRKPLTQVAAVSEVDGQVEEVEAAAAGWGRAGQVGGGVKSVARWPTTAGDRAALDCWYLSAAHLNPLFSRMDSIWAWLYLLGMLQRQGRRGAGISVAMTQCWDEAIWHTLLSCKKKPGKLCWTGGLTCGS